MMADEALQTRVAQLEKEKRQRDFQYSALESLLKKTKAENDGRSRVPSRVRVRLRVCMSACGCAQSGCLHVW